ncbi:MAG: lipid A oxidase, partial [Proteobacteria bacterium]|nr:lipid A oxidase [Pseudomonadota bacterium]
MTVSLTAAFHRARRAAVLGPLADIERLSALLTAILLAGMLAMASLGPDDLAAPSSDANASPYAQRETVGSIYAGAPFYHRSDVRLTQPGGTDVTLKRMGWDGDSLYFPIDGGARVIRWSGSLGLMVDFLHNKAIARLGKGSHGRKISNGVIEDVETSGTLKGQTAPSPLHLTDLFDRLEFTHGHNTLMLTGLARLPPVVPSIRPYVGAGFGAAVPHVEVWFTGSANDKRTSEYQVAGPAFQLLAGLELRSGRGSYYLEYKFIWASIDAALTGSRSTSLKDLQSPWLPRWLIEPFAGLMEMPGDMWRQVSRWLRG